MQEDFSFEERIKEKISGIRIHPSDKVWKALHQDLSRTFHPGMQYPVLLFIFIILIFSSLSISNHSAFLFIYTDNYSAIVNKSALTHTETLENKPQILNKSNDAFRYRLLPITHDHKQMSEVYDYEGFLFKEAASKYVALKEHLSERTDTVIAERINLSESSISVSDLKKTNISNRELIEKKEKYNALQFYIAPSYSYPLVTQREKNNGSYYDFSNDSSSYYIPSAGLEAGLALWKPINNKWAIKSGFLINMSTYELRSSSNMNDIEMPKSEKTTNSNELKNNKPSSLSGAKLMNQNFRFSVPIEVEYMLAGNKALSFFMSGSLQPSFSVYSTGNIITSEFKDHTPVDPYLYRRFNVLTGLECFFRLNAGSFDIQAGPQIRYQLLSNNVGASPYREHLMDYSMKIGIIKKIY